MPILYKFFILILSIGYYLFFCSLYLKDVNYIGNKEKMNFDLYEVNKYNEIKEPLIRNKCSQMWDNQREFLNGIVRKYKPKKILEIGVNYGGSSTIILNAIDDLKASILYSIDLNTSKDIGRCVKKYFSNFLKKWKLFQGNIATEFLQEIGNNIDMVLIDSAHFEPGEIMDFLIVLPFLKEKAIVIFHDIANQITRTIKRNEYAPYIIFNGIRGKKFYPSGNNILTHDIGAIQLEINQKKYYHDYFRLLGGQWQYFPKEIHINQTRKFFQKYYDRECLIIFEEAVSFNRNFVKNNPKKVFYEFSKEY